MKKLFRTLLAALIVIATFSLSLQKVKAYSCSDFSISPSSVTPGENVSVIFSPGLIENEFVRASIRGTSVTGNINCVDEPNLCSARPTALFNLATNGLANQTYNVDINYTGAAGINDTLQCSYPLIINENVDNFCSPTGLNSVDPSSGFEDSTFNFGGCVGATSAGGVYVLVLKNANDQVVREVTIPAARIESDGNFLLAYRNTLNFGRYTAQLYINRSPTGSARTFDIDDGSPVDPNPDPETNVPFEICNQIPENFNGGVRDKCIECQEAEGIWTAIGCIEAQPQSIVATVVQIGLGLAGGVAILMILAAAFLFSTSQGDPKRTTQARELVTAAVIGLLFIIFSVTILQFIGVSILQIPDFGV